MRSKLDPKLILIIDDELNLREGAKRILTKMDFQVLIAPNGDKGLALLEDEYASIVLLDMKMPGMDGMEVLSRIVKMDRGILVIVITGYATVETAIEAMKQGAYDFIPKPYEPDQLRIVVNRARDKVNLTRETEKLEQEQRRTLSDLHTEKTRIHTIINYLPEGLMVTNTDGQVVLMNPAFKRHLGIDQKTDVGKNITEYISDQNLCELIRDISRGKHVDYDDIPSYELTISDQKFLLAKGRPVLGDSGACLGAIVNLTDISAIKAIDKIKSEFVAKVSHELRSPLSTIHEQLAVVIDEIADEASEQGRQMLARAKEKTFGLISTIGDLLDLSRIEAGITSKNPKTVDVPELLTGIVDFLGIRAKNKNQALTIKKPEEDFPPIITDPIALESVFGNLITNAINYTQENGKIEIVIDQSGSYLRIIVKDNGFGIEAKYLEKIFERFYRVKNEKTRFITGTGLGLPIVKAIVESLNGYLEVDSEPGKGTSFTVLLPVKK